MIIPKRFMLGAIPISVIPDPTLSTTKGILGETKYVEQSIHLDIDRAPVEMTEHAYIHELVHWILFAMHRHELREDEAFVDLFALFLHQAIETQEGQLV